jgi:hypothetical protein
MPWPTSDRTTENPRSSTWALGGLHETFGYRGDRADRKGPGGVGDPAVEHDADVDREDVAALEHIGPGDAMDHHRVRGGADRSRKAPVPLECGLGAL